MWCFLSMVPHVALSQSETTIARTHVVTMQLSGVIEWFSQANGLTVVLPDGGDARVRDVTLSADFDAFANWLRVDHGMDYYRRGDTVYLSSADLSRERIVTLDYITASESQQMMRDYDLYVAHPVSTGGTQDNVIILNGPPDYLSLAESLIARFEGENKPGQRAGVKIMRGGVRDP